MGFCRLSIWCSTESELTLEKGENEKKGGKGGNDVKPVPIVLGNL